MDKVRHRLHVVVGATSPIARSYAIARAVAGDHLVLAGRDLAELELIAADLKIRYGVQVDVASYDASRLGEGLGLARKLAGRPVSSVVAFHGVMGDRDDFARMLQVNCASIAEFFEALADEAGRTRSKLVLAAVSSVAGDRGRQSNYPYGASKAALDAYLSGLRNRLHPLGVRVVTIKPGFVRTRLTVGKVNPRSPLLADPAQVAADILRAVDVSGDVVYTRWFWAPIMAIIRAIPEVIFKRLKL